MFFGSYFGDWDSQNDFLRAALATTNYTLTSAWVGRPYWFFHHMALGKPSDSAPGYRRTTNPFIPVGSTITQCMWP